LESKKDSFNIFRDSNKNSEFENHFYSKSINNKLKDQFLDEIPTISKIFIEKLKCQIILLTLIYFLKVI